MVLDLQRVGWEGRVAGMRGGEGVFPRDTERGEREG